MENAVNELIKKSFKNGVINGAVLMSKKDNGYNYVFYTKYSDIKKHAFFHPIMKINGAKIFSAITKENDNNLKTLFLMKPCEIRAAIELKKLNQGDLNNSIFISYTCSGVLEFKEANDLENSEEYLKDFIGGNLNENIRTSCKVCTLFSGEGSDIVVDLFNDKFVALTGKGEEFLEKIGLEYEKDILNNEVLEKIKNVKKDNLKNFLKEKKKYFKSEEKVVEFFDKCIGCHACSHSCPICYCRQCYFESETFKYYPDSIKRKLDYKGALRLPLDRVMFHLGRVTHMAASCVGCGMCEEVCPVNIKVSEFFKYMGNNIQQTFNYTPGINSEEPLPLLTFKEEEFQEVED